MRRYILGPLAFAAILAMAGGCHRPTEDEVYKAKVAKLEAEIAAIENSRLDASFKAELAGETAKMLETAQLLTPYLTKEDASWFAADIAECVEPPADRSTAQRMQKVREVHARLKAELHRRR